MKDLKLINAGVQSESVDSVLTVFRSGDFIVLPKGYGIDFRRQLFRSDRKRSDFNLDFTPLNCLPLKESFCFVPTLLAWLFRKRWRLKPYNAVRFRGLLVDNGFNLIYVKDDLYRVSLFRSSKFKVRFTRDLPALLLGSPDMSHLNHTKHSGFDIYFKPTYMYNSSRGRKYESINNRQKNILL